MSKVMKDMEIEEAEIEEAEETEETKEKGPITSPLKAIRAFCIDCCGGQRNWVSDCKSENCPLWAFRMAKNPYYNRKPMTEEHKQKLLEGMKKYREGRE